MILIVLVPRFTKIYFSINCVRFLKEVKRIILCKYLAPCSYSNEMQSWKRETNVLRVRNNANSRRADTRSIR
jgi:hypothetical protein